MANLLEKKFLTGKKFVYIISIVLSHVPMILHVFYNDHGNATNISRDYSSQKIYDVYQEITLQLKISPFKMSLFRLERKGQEMCIFTAKNRGKKQI